MARGQQRVISLSLSKAEIDGLLRFVNCANSFLKGDPSKITAYLGMPSQVKAGETAVSILKTAKRGSCEETTDTGPNISGLDRWTKTN